MSTQLHKRRGKNLTVVASCSFTSRRVRKKKKKENLSLNPSCPSVYLSTSNRAQTARLISYSVGLKCTYLHHVMYMKFSFKFRLIHFCDHFISELKLNFGYILYSFLNIISITELLLRTRKYFPDHHSTWRSFYFKFQSKIYINLIFWVHSQIKKKNYIEGTFVVKILGLLFVHPAYCNSF